MLFFLGLPGDDGLGPFSADHWGHFLILSVHQLHLTYATSIHYSLAAAFPDAARLVLHSVRNFRHKQFGRAAGPIGGAGPTPTRGASGLGAHKPSYVGGPAFEGMSAELIGILGVAATLLSVGVALGLLTLARKRNTMQRLADMDSRLATCAARGTPRGCPRVAMSIAGWWNSGPCHVTSRVLARVARSSASSRIVACRSGAGASPPRPRRAALGPPAPIHASYVSTSAEQTSRQAPRRCSGGSLVVLQY